ncbi:MAG: hypothetical protein E7407_04145 [Ruminococcaceae bacterium]|nr:hypothetical protein [Oscillospiraceae bacterium]
MSFENFAGNEYLKTQLRRFIISGQILNSYVFSGENGIGKRTLSQEFIKELFCEAPQKSGACGTCSACRQVISASHPDVYYLKKQKDKKSYGIEDIREQIIKQVYIKPFIASRKIFVIGEGDDLTREAQNGLLKVLEEPPQYVTFIILVTKKNMLLDTVLSRSCVLNLHPAPLKDVSHFLQKTYSDINEEKLAFYTRFSQGIIGKAIKIINDENYRALFFDTSKHLSSVIKSREALIDFHRFLLENKDEIDSIIDFMLIFLRDCIFSCEGLKNMVICPQNLKNVLCINACKKRYISCMETVINCKNKLSFNVNFSFWGLDLLTEIQNIFDND